MNHQGQSLVETALILPVLFLILWVFLQIVLLCRNALVLQSVAAQYGRIEAIGDPADHAWLQGLLSKNRLIGHTTPPAAHFTTAPIQPWRRMRSLPPTTPQQGEIVLAKASAWLLPRAFFKRTIPFTSLEFSAEYPREPVVPQER